MLVDRARAQPQNLGDVAVGLALAEPGENLALAPRQAEGASEIGGIVGLGGPRDPQQKLRWT